MALMEQITRQLMILPPEKQREVLGFILFLQHRIKSPSQAKPRSLKTHPAFGTWQQRHLDAVAYQQAVRAEWCSE